MKQKHCLPLTVGLLLCSIFSLILMITPRIASAADRNAIIMAQRVESSGTADHRITTYRKAQFIQGDAKLDSDIIVSRNDSMAHHPLMTASQPFLFATPMSTVTADMVEIDTHQLIASFTTKVQMRITREEQSKEPKKEIVISADKLSFDYGKNQATFTGHVISVTEKERTELGDTATYDLASGKFTGNKLTGSPEK